jgi:ABC-type sugar transport system substrate-binding protein
MRLKSLFAACILGFAALGVAAVSHAEDVRLFVRHQVACYATWRKSYDGFAAEQKKAGVFYQAVYRSTDNPNDITVIHDFHSLEEAKAFAASPSLKAAMEKSGVIGTPQIWYTVKAAKKK